MHQRTDIMISNICRWVEILTEINTVGIIEHKQPENTDRNGMNKFYWYMKMESHEAFYNKKSRSPKGFENHQATKLSIKGSLSG